MNNNTIIDSLSREDLLSLSDLLVRTLMSRNESLSDIADWELFVELDSDVINYCDNLNNYQQLRFLQEIINTLVKEEDQVHAIGNQLKLPILG